MGRASYSGNGFKDGINFRKSNFMILITGAFGQVGKILQEKLDESYNLILVDIKEDKTFKTRASSQILIGDLQNFDFVNSIFKKYKFDFVFNLKTNSFGKRN